MSKIQRVTIEFDDKILSIQGEEAEKWSAHITSLSVMAQNRAGNQNPFDYDPVKWETVDKDITTEIKKGLLV
jgi:hypothetical protein